MYNHTIIIEMLYKIHQIDNITLSAKSRLVNTEVIDHSLYDKFH